MSGVEILASEQVGIGYDLSSATIATMIFTIIICIVIGLYFFINDGDFANVLGMSAIGIMLSLLLGGVVQELTKKPSGYEIQYKITISDEVKMNDFYEKYEIINQDGKIFTVREKQ